MGTFQGFCAYILKRDAKYLGFSSGFTILDKEDSKELLRQILEAKNFQFKKKERETLEILNDFDKYKSKTKVEEFDLRGNHGHNLPVYRNFYEEYKKLKDKLCALDYSDLIYYTRTLLVKNDE